MGEQIAPNWPANVKMVCTFFFFIGKISISFLANFLTSEQIGVYSLSLDCDLRPAVKLPSFFQKGPVRYFWSGLKSHHSPYYVGIKAPFTLLLQWLCAV